MVKGFGRPQRREWAIVALLLAVAALLRLVALGDVPPGPGYDELQDARLSERVLAGEWAVYFPENFGQEPLYPALAALAVRLLGWSVVVLRLPGALSGVATVLALYLIARRFQFPQPGDAGAAGRHTAILAASFQAVSFWPLIATRMALETTLLPPMSALAILFLARGLEGPAGVRPGPRRSRGWRSVLSFALAGLFIGGQVYAYTPGRVMPVLLPALLLYLALLNRQALRRHWAGLLLLCLVTALVVAPLALFLRAHPESEQRLDQLSGPLERLRQGDPGPVLETAIGTLSMFSLRGEPQWLYNVADRPLFDPLTSLFFCVGLALCLFRLRDWRYGLALLWLLVGLATAFISPPAASFTHTLIAQPAIYLILGLGTAAVGERVARWRAWAGPLLAASLLAGNALLAWHAYFVTWAGSPQVRELYQGGITAVARDLDAHDPPGPVAVGAPYINYWHPWNAVGFDLALRREDLSVRWFNPAGGWVWPAGPGPATFYFPADPLGAQRFDPALEALFAPDAVLLPRSDDAFTAYRVARPLALERRLATLPSTPVAWPTELVSLPPPGLPLTFGDRLALLGVELGGTHAAPGDTLRLITYWEVLATDPAPVVAFVHLTSDGQDIWGQQDWLDVRPAGLLPGDRFAQAHVVPIKPKTPPGLYHVQLGLYAPDTLVRLSIPAAGSGVADRVWVGEVQVTQP
jgi:4-amino-4-deoxy-L-arabinose transferase-like glycosyltransferase